MKKLNFYNTRITEDRRTVLIKEKVVDYSIDRLPSEQKVVEMMNDLISIGYLAEEYCYMIAVNTNCCIIGIFFLSKGTVASCLLGVREIYLRALLCGASFILLVHNHPSKNVIPSKEDKKITKKIQDAGAILEIPLLDHIIIGGDSFFSFKANNLIP